MRWTLRESTMGEEARWWKISFAKLSVNSEKVMRQFHPQTQATAATSLDSRLHKVPHSGPCPAVPFSVRQEVYKAKWTCPPKAHTPSFPCPLTLPVSSPFYPSILNYTLSSIQFISVAQSYLTLCDPMDCSMPGFPVHHQLYSIHGYAKSLQWCPILCDPMDCILSGSFVHGILQARILEWVAIGIPNPGLAKMPSNPL